MSKKFHVKKNDQVMVMAGKEKGKSGKLLRIIAKKEGALIEKVNFVKRHSRPSGQNRQGGIIEKEAPLPLSNIMIICAKCTVPVKVGRKILDDGKRVRYCKKCGEHIDL
jgi:large subunit ribosomal protein L24